MDDLTDGTEDNAGNAAFQPPSPCISDKENGSLSQHPYLNSKIKFLVCVNLTPHHILLESDLALISTPTSNGKSHFWSTQKDLHGL